MEKDTDVLPCSLLGITECRKNSSTINKILLSTCISICNQRKYWQVKDKTWVSQTRLWPSLNNAHLSCFLYQQELFIEMCFWLYFILLYFILLYLLVGCTTSVSYTHLPLLVLIIRIGAPWLWFPKRWFTHCINN